MENTTAVEKLLQGFSVTPEGGLSTKEVFSGLGAELKAAFSTMFGGTPEYAGSSVLMGQTNLSFEK